MPCQSLTVQSPGRRGAEATTAYLDKDHSSNGFQDQHDSHGEGVDAGIILHVRIVLHAAAHRGLIPMSHCGVLFEDKALWDKTTKNCHKPLLRAILILSPRGACRMMTLGPGVANTGRLCLPPPLFSNGQGQTACRCATDKRYFRDSSFHSGWYLFFESFNQKLEQFP